METQSTKLRANFRYLYADIFWYGVLAGSTIAFLSVYVARLGGNSFQISLLTAIPAVINLFLSLPSGNWLETQPLHSATTRTLFLHRLGYLILIFLPWLFTPHWEIWAIVFVTLVMYIPGTIQAIGFNALFAAVVPPEWRAEVVGKRFAIQSFSITVTSLLCGQILDRISFPLNYQIVFAIGGVAAMLSTLAVARLIFDKHKKDAKLGKRTDFRWINFKTFRQKSRIESVSPSPSNKSALSYLSFKDLPKLLRVDLIRSPYGAFMGAYLIFYLVQYVPIPLFPLILVRLLHLTDGEISFANAIFYTSMLIGSMGISRLSNRFGHRWVLIVSGGLIFIFPLIYAVAKNAYLVWVNNLIGGIIWAGVNNGAINRLMERVPENDRPAHMALYNVVLNLGMLSGSLLGPALGESLGLREA
ncbi:MAG: MFS transporter, partial [Candidatus Kryptoniota bacterium]